MSIDKTEYLVRGRKSMTPTGEKRRMIKHLRFQLQMWEEELQRVVLKHEVSAANLSKDAQELAKTYMSVKQLQDQLKELTEK